MGSLEIILDPACHFNAIKLGHHHVGYDDIRMKFLEAGQSIQTVFSGFDFKGGFENIPDIDDDLNIVFNDQHFLFCKIF